MDFYFTIDGPGCAEYKDRGSKFIAHAFPVRDKAGFKAHLQAIRGDHPKAVHHCFAYRIGYDGNDYRVSDDGEPAGTAGKQILGQIDSRDLSDILVIVVRYFGGTLLGVPGLITAYKTATSLALQCTSVVQKSIELMYTIQFNYTEMNDVMRLLKKHHCIIYENEIQLFCRLQTGIPKKNAAEVCAALGNLLDVEVTPFSKVP
jgi:uncharacterized YigZ family protein